MKLGAFGEKCAANYLQKKGYKILARNFRSRWGELDIIAEKNKKIFFFEVKTRRSLRAGLPEESVTPWKIKHLQKAAFIFLQKNNLQDRDYTMKILSVKML